jgi:hypothetical protein
MASKRDEKQSLSKTPVGLSALTLASIHHTYAQAHRRHGHRHHDHHDHHDHHGSHRPRGSSLLFTWIVIPLIAAVVWGGYGGTGEVPMARTEVKARLQECNITQGGVYDMFNEMTATEDAGHALLMVQLVRFKSVPKDNPCVLAMCAPCLVRVCSGCSPNGAASEEKNCKLGLLTLSCLVRLLESNLPCAPG